MNSQTSYEFTEFQRIHRNIYIYIYGRWHLIMAGRVGHPSGGIGGLTTELQKCFVICHASGASLCIPCQIWGGALMPSIGSGVKIDFVLRASRRLTFYRA